MRKRDEQLVEWVSDELGLDPKVRDHAIAVTAENGTVTLRGTVGTLREKREAEKDAKRVSGVDVVDNELQVKPLVSKADADLRGDVLGALALDSLVPKTIDAKVEGGRVTLTGIADWQYQREEAEYVASNIVGALHVDDDITLKPHPDLGDVKGAITRAFQRGAKLDADNLSVQISEGMVTLEGTVGSWAEHDEALAAAWSASGVTQVVDHVTVRHWERG